MREQAGWRQRDRAASSQLKRVGGWGEKRLLRSPGLLHDQVHKKKEVCYDYYLKRQFGEATQ